MTSDDSAWVVLNVLRRKAARRWWKKGERAAGGACALGDSPSSVNSRSNSPKKKRRAETSFIGFMTFEWNCDCWQRQEMCREILSPPLLSSPFVIVVNLSSPRWAAPHSCEEIRDHRIYTRFVGFQFIRSRRPNNEMLIMRRADGGRVRRLNFLNGIGKRRTMTTATLDRLGWKTTGGGD